MKHWRKLSNGQWFNSNRQTFTNHCPFLEGKTIMTTSGLMSVMEYSEFIKKTNGYKAVITAFCGNVTESGKTTYANFIDFSTIKTGKRKIRNVWVGINFPFEKEKAYMLKCERDDDYLDGIKVLNCFEIKK